MLDLRCYHPHLPFRPLRLHRTTGRHLNLKTIDIRGGERLRLVLAASAALAAAIPSLLAYNVSPSATFLNQALAFALWPAFVLFAAPGLEWRGSKAVQGALALLVACALVSWGAGALPASLSLSAVGSLLAAMVMLAGGAGARARSPADGVSGGRSNIAVDLFAAFCWGWLIAGLLNVFVGAVQVFAPNLADGDWIAASGYAGRAVGNLRQPNHLSSLLLWSCIAVAVLLQLGRIGTRAALAVFAALVFTVVLTASRTGLVSVVLLAVWGLLDRRLSRTVRGLLLAAPLMYAAAWLGMAQWAALSQHSFGGTERLAETDISSSRFAIWRDTLMLIRQQPWTGVGFGEFNFAWTLTPLPTRPTALFDHTHNLPLQLAVELGLPMASLVLGLLLFGLWVGARNAWQAQGEMAATQRGAMVMVVMIGLHSLLEYPLWYSYFLLPTAWAWGYALWSPDSAKRDATAVAQALPGVGGAATMRHQPSMPLAVALVAVVLGAGLAVIDYSRVVAIFSASEGAGPLAQRVAAGQRSVRFAHHADYAAATSGIDTGDPEAAERAFARATHYLLDTRLMIAWSKSLAERGELNAARFVAERLREFRKADAEDFFRACPQAASPADAQAAAPGSFAAGAASAASAAFQCELPARAPGWREFAVP